MIRIHEYAIISSHVYQVDLKNYMGIKFAKLSAQDVKLKKIPDGWNFLPDIAPHLDPANHFYAALYLKFSQGTAIDAVIAFRGTMMSDWNNILADVWSWYSSAIGNNWHQHYPIYFAEAAAFSEIAIEYINRNFPKLNPAGIRFTGHSLGGALAQLIAARCSFHPAVAFNSPSCRGMMSSRISQVWPLVTNVNSRYDVINKLGGNPIGKLNVIDVTEMETEARSLFANFNRAEFTRGEKLEQLTEKINVTGIDAVRPVVNLVGTELHIAALLEANRGIDKLPTEHMKIVVCEGEQNYQGMTEIIYTLSKNERCDLTVTFESVAQTILAQHQIDNVIKALYEMPKVANQVI